MNLRLLIFLGVFIIGGNLQAFTQDLSWYKRFNCSNIISLEGLNADTSGHLYLGGFFKGNCDFDLGPTEYWLSAGNRRHIYLEKMKSDGTMQWVHQWGGTALDTTIVVVGFDKLGNSYLEGRFTDSLDLDPGPDEYWMEPASPSSVFILKLDSDGQFVWAIQFPLFTTPPVADSEGNIWLAIDFNGEIDADPGPGVYLLYGLVPVSSFNTAIIKLDLAGNFLWAGAIERVHPIATTLDRQGNFYLRGLFVGTPDVDPGPGVFELGHESSSGDDYLNLKLDTAGALVWAAHTARGTKSFSTLYFGGMEVDEKGQVFMSTQIIGGYDVDPGPDELILDASANDILVMKLDSLGNLSWANHLKNPSLETVLDLKLDAENNCYVTGYLSEDADMDPGPALVISPNNRGGDFDAYLLKYDSAGSFQWVTRYGGKMGEWGWHLAVDQIGRVTAGGPCRGIMDFGNLPGEDFIPASSTNQSFFLVQVSQDGRYSGTVFRDLNNNQVLDAGEPGVPNMVLNAGDYRFISTNADGEYRFASDITGDTLQVSQFRPYWQIEPDFALPDSLHLVNDFTFEQPDTVRDAAIEVVSVGNFRPGFTSHVWMQVANLGNTLIDSLQVSLDSFSQDPALSVLFSLPQPEFQTPEHLEWRIDSLNPGASRTIRLWFHTPDTVSLGTPIDFPVAALLPNDLDQGNNYRRLQTTVMGAFDPNDKQVTPELLPEPKLEEATLQYLIRFQNTGDLPAEFVILRDTLPATLDLSSLEILGASHAFTWRLRDAGILEFHFNQIHLPDSLSDPQGSQGFAAFRIRPLRSLQLGDSIINRAGIYFDYNPPVITAAAVTVLTKTNAVPSLTSDYNSLDFNILPNPAAVHSPVMLSLPATHAGGHLQLGDLYGRTLIRQGIPADTRKVQLPGLPAGLYTVQVQIAGRQGVRLLLVE